MLHAFGENRVVIENFEYLGEFEEDFRKCWLYCVLYLFVIERCNKKFKNNLEGDCRMRLGLAKSYVVE